MKSQFPRRRQLASFQPQRNLSFSRFNESDKQTQICDVRRLKINRGKRMHILLITKKREFFFLLMNNVGRKQDVSADEDNNKMC